MTLNEIQLFVSRKSFKSYNITRITGDIEVFTESYTKVSRILYPATRLFSRINSQTTPDLETNYLLQKLGERF